MTPGDRARAYRAVFYSARADGDATAVNPPGVDVLRDLARICYVSKTTASRDPIAMGVAEGRRQVWLHIKAQLALTDDQISRLTEYQEPDI